LRFRDVAERAMRRGSRLLVTKPLALQALHFQLQMSLNFSAEIVELAFAPGHR
jgi:hypothetical protein